MLAQAFIISLLLSASEVLKRQSDHSCSGGPQSCPCTSAIQQAAQSCLNCLATTDAAAAAGAGLEFNPATLASQFNSNCATSSVSVTIPQGVATGSVGEPSVSASVASTSYVAYIVFILMFIRH
ncbi:hypothetical protein JR316_0012301 [Psilocybe cubensis]|uniref:Uncharacterized protein n=2 Tax=Psilocybe cubensis TaxID=181762 RepID=A0ACB8GJH9_PSICU|nr:hypothetical protein JR316_0012301 [Psilocybe cubensis]KAH9475190.1 hypothetical protein JR316_0012301 [Psilocybe cubensis]